MYYYSFNQWLCSEMGIGLNVCFSISVCLDDILPNWALLIDVLKSTPWECSLPAIIWQEDLDNQDKSLKAQFSFAFHLSANGTWCSGEDKQCLSPRSKRETSRQKRLACGQTGMWTDRHVGRQADRKTCRYYRSIIRQTNRHVHTVTDRF